MRSPARSILVASRRRLCPRWWVHVDPTYDSAYFENLAGRLYGLVISLSDRLPADQAQWLHHVVDVGEYGLGLPSMRVVPTPPDEIVQWDRGASIVRSHVDIATRTTGVPLDCREAQALGTQDESGVSTVLAGEDVALPRPAMDPPVLLSPTVDVAHCGRIAPRRAVVDVVAASVNAECNEVSAPRLAAESEPAAVWVAIATHRGSLDGACGALLGQRKRQRAPLMGCDRWEAAAAPLAAAPLAAAPLAAAPLAAAPLAAAPTTGPSSSSAIASITWSSDSGFS